MQNGIKVLGRHGVEQRANRGPDRLGGTRYCNRFRFFLGTRPFKGRQAGGAVFGGQALGLVDLFFGDAVVAEIILFKRPEERKFFGA